MKHAYLIISHNEFEVLEKLVQALDDERNDIFIHFDKKLKRHPVLRTLRAGLYLLKERVDIRWGHISLVKAEYALFEAAYSRGGYSYYHLLSGVHFPLKSQDYIYNFFEGLKDKDVFTSVPNCDYQTEQKMRRYNFFVKNFMHKNCRIKQLDQFLWKVCLRIQKVLHIYRHKGRSYKIASEWVSVTSSCVGYLLQIKKDVLRRYRFTLASDEFFIPSELSESHLRDNMYYYDKLLKCDFEGSSSPRTYRLKDYEELLDSDCLFARKFSHTDMDIINKIFTHIVSES